MLNRFARPLKISVIIPTYNRAKTLEECLQAYNQQSLSPDTYEVVVVDDGSQDNTKRVVESSIGKLNYKIRYHHQPNKGPAAARNYGIREASTNIILITGDDIVPSYQLLEEHLKSHKDCPNVAILGLTRWHPELEITPFMHYLAPYGPQFNYDIKDPQNCGYAKFWTANISLEKKWFEKDPFDEDFPYPAYEDLELGYRLHKKGLRVVLNKKAVGYHNHYYPDIQSFQSRNKRAGKSAKYLIRKHPGFRKRFVWGKGILFPLFFLLNQVAKPFDKFYLCKTIQWEYKMRLYYWQGFFS